jgi:hypothetical protein
MRNFDEEQGTPEELRQRRRNEKKSAKRDRQIKRWEHRHRRRLVWFFLRMLIVVLIVFVVAILLERWQFGFPWSGGQNIGFGTPPSTTEAPAQSAIASPAADATETESLIIDVSEEEVLYNGGVVTLDELKEILLNRNQPGFIWILQDSHAKKAVYDQVKALLGECSVQFTER